MAWKITSNNGTMYPPEVLVDDDTIMLTDAEIDEELPASCHGAGTIIYTADFGTIKQKNFDGEWIVVG